MPNIDDIYKYEDLSAHELELVRHKPEEITSMLAVNLRVRRERMRPGDRQLVDRALRKRAEKRAEKREPKKSMTQEERKAAKDAIKRGEDRFRSRREKETSPYTFIPTGGGDAA